MKVLSIIYFRFSTLIILFCIVILFPYHANAFNIKIVCDKINLTTNISPTYSDGIIYVNVNAGNANDGTSWTNAFNTLQDALTTANNCLEVEQIWVAQGKYYPDRGQSFTLNNQEHSFSLLNNLTIYGGFSGNEAPDYMLSLRDFTLNETIISGDIGIENDNSDNTNIIFSNSNLDNSAVLDGITIVDGLIHGMDNNSSSPTITNCIFKDISGTHAKGAMRNDNSSPVLNSCLFIDNESTAEDGIGIGMHNRNNSFPILTDCIFKNNNSTDAVSIGGAIFNNNSSVILTRCSFINNLAEFGGVIFNNNSSTTTYTDCIFQGNVGADSYSVINHSNSDKLTMINCLFTGNRTNHDGTIHVAGSHLTLINCTIADNYCSISGGAAITVRGNPTLELYNSIIWHNVTDGNGRFSSNSINTNLDGSQSFSASNCLIEDYNPTGSGNIDGINPDNAPLFIEPILIFAHSSIVPDLPIGNYRLAPCSPVIDQGNNFQNNSVTDLAGNSRVSNTTIDLGVYEFQGDDNLPVIGLVEYSSTVDNDSGSCSAIIEVTHPLLTDNYSLSGCQTSFTYELTGDTEQEVTPILIYDGTIMEDISFNVGETTITYRAIDAAGNTAIEKEKVITVTNNTEPTNCNNPLVLESIDFSLKNIDDRIVEISWQGMLNNIRYLIIERSIDGKQFSEIGQVDTFIDIFLDKSPHPGRNIYRLKAIKNDNSFIITQIKSTILPNNAQAFLFPNPTNGQLYIKTTEDIIDVLIYNVIGKQIDYKFNDSSMIDINNQPSGIYLIKVITHNKEFTNHIFKR